MKTELVKTSKFLSYVLRHKPDAIGLRLDEEGWASVDELIARAGEGDQHLKRELIAEVVATNDKKRFSLSQDGSRIRANQGHSVKVDLGLAERTPPRFLYHGTATRFLKSIRPEGLKPSGRRHVHLSSDHDTAVVVGQRHGKPVVLKIEAARMCADGHKFYRSENGVWLTDSVPPGYFVVAGVKDGG